MLRHFLNPPNWFTTANLFCGFYAILLVAAPPDGQPAFYRAGLMLVFAGVFDMLDGRVARMTRSSSQFGTQLDSLSDLVSFGVAPAILAWAWGLEQLGVVGLAAAFTFVTCGAFRLARFNLETEEDVLAESNGLTITLAGITLAAIIMVHAHTGRTHLAHPLNAFGMMLALSYLMVSRVPYRTFKDFKLRPMTMALLALTLGITVTIGSRYDISVALVAVSVPYVLSGPVESMFRRRRRATDTLFAFEEDEDDCG